MRIFVAHVKALVRLRRPGGYGDFLQLAGGEERHVGAVRRPKRIRRTLSAREHRRTRRTHTLDVQHVLAGGIIASDEGEHPAVSRECQVADWGWNGYRELHSLCSGRVS